MFETFGMTYMYRMSVEKKIINKSYALCCQTSHITLNMQTQLFYSMTLYLARLCIDTMQMSVGHGAAFKTT